MSKWPKQIVAPGRPHAVSKTDVETTARMASCGLSLRAVMVRVLCAGSAWAWQVWEKTHKAHIVHKTQRWVRQALTKFFRPAWWTRPPSAANMLGPATGWAWCLERRDYGQSWSEVSHTCLTSTSEVSRP